MECHVTLCVALVLSLSVHDDPNHLHRLPFTTIAAHLY